MHKLSKTEINYNNFYDNQSNNTFQNQLYYKDLLNKYSKLNKKNKDRLTTSSSKPMLEISPFKKKKMLNSNCNINYNFKDSCSISKKNNQRKSNSNENKRAPKNAVLNTKNNNYESKINNNICSNNSNFKAVSSINNSNVHSISPGKSKEKLKLIKMLKPPIKTTEKNSSLDDDMSLNKNNNFIMRAYSYAKLQADRENIKYNISSKLDKACSIIKEAISKNIKKPSTSNKLSSLKKNSCKGTSKSKIVSKEKNKDISYNIKYNKSNTKSYCFP